MELMLDSLNLEDLKDCLSTLPVSGVTSNPSIFKKENTADFWGHMTAVKALLSADQSLHVQVLSDDRNEILREAEEILSRLGAETHIKIPVTEEGLAAIRQLTGRGVHVTATAIHTTMQGILAALAGADYAALYYNRMRNMEIDSNAVLRTLRLLLDRQHSPCRLLAASFQNAGQVTEALANGAHSVTVSPDILRRSLRLPVIRQTIADFRRDGGLPSEA